VIRDAKKVEKHWNIATTANVSALDMHQHSTQYLSSLEALHSYQSRIKG